MPALREVIDLLEEQRKDFEQKEKEVEEEKMRLQYDLEHTQSHLQSLERSHDRTQSELEQHYYDGVANRRNSTSTSRTIRRPSTMPLSSSLSALNKYDNEDSSYNKADDDNNNNNNMLPLDETVSEEELHQEMMRLLTTLREKQKELLLLGGDDAYDDYPPQHEDDQDDDYMMVLGPAVLQQHQQQHQLSHSQSQRSFLGIDMTGSSWSGPLTDDDDDDDDLEYSRQQDPEYAGQPSSSGWVPPFPRPSVPFASPTSYEYHNYDD